MSDSSPELPTHKEFAQIDPQGAKEIFHTMWLETHLGTRYEMPDMLREHVGVAHAALDKTSPDGKLVVTNISDSALVIPKRIVKKAGVGDRCFWEAS